MPSIHINNTPFPFQMSPIWEINYMITLVVGLRAELENTTQEHTD